MRNPLESLIKRLGSMYSIERDNGSVDPVKGLINQEQSTGKRYIGFLPGTDIQVDDWLTNPSGDRFYVIDKETATFQGKPHELRCFIETEAEQKKKALTTGPIFNIGSATGSIIGTQVHASLNYSDSINQMKEQVQSSSSPDKDDLQQLLSLLEMLVNDRIPAQKGMFSKFSDVMERNSWITSAISSTLLGWLMSQIH